MKKADPCTLLIFTVQRYRSMEEYCSLLCHLLEGAIRGEIKNKLVLFWPSGNPAAVQVGSSHPTESSCSAEKSHPVNRNHPSK